MTDPTIAKQYIDSLTALYAHLNSNTYANYQNAFGNYQKALQQNPSAIAPAPPSLTVFNSALALQLFTTWGDSLGTLASTAPYPVLDLSPAISYVTAAPIVVPPPVIPPPPADPVGPSQGVRDSQGREMFYNVSGDTFIPGQAFPDSRGTFVHQVFSTPFGIESYWAKVA